MRVTFGGLFIAIGITLLWLAATGNLDRLGKAWDTVTGKTEGGERTASNASGAQSLALPPMPTIRPQVLEMPSLPTLG